MGTITILDVTDPAAFGRIPPCADPGFDHRSCDYWEDADRGSKAARLVLARTGPGGLAEAPRPRPTNPFLADLEAKAPVANPFATERPANPFLTPGDDEGRRPDREPIRAGTAAPPEGRPRRAAQAPVARARPRGRRQLRQGAARGRRREGVCPVRAADRLSRERSGRATSTRRSPTRHSPRSSPASPRPPRRAAPASPRPSSRRSATT